jgi:O-antigen ligase
MSTRITRNSGRNTVRTAARNPSAQRAQSRLLQFGVIAGVLLLSMLFALVTSTERIDWWLLLGVAAAAVGVILTARRRDASALGLVLILATAGMANIFSLPTGTGSLLVISLILSVAFTAIWLFNALFLNKHQIRFVQSPLNAPVLAWCAVSLVAYVWSLLMRDPLLYVPRSFMVVQIAALVVNILLPLQMLLVVNTVGVLAYDDGVRWLRRMVAVVLLIAAVAIVGETFRLPLINRFYLNGIRGLFGMWAFVLAMALVLYDATLSKWVRLGLLVLAGAWFYHDFVRHSGWLSGWLPMVVAGGVLAFLRSKRLFALALLVVLAYVAINWQDLYLRIVVSNVEEGSMSRLDIWAMAMSYIQRHPLFGMGPAGYAVYYMTYNPLDARSTHNNLFDVVAQAGVIGLLVFLWMGGALLMLAWRLTRTLPGERTFEAALAAAVTAGAVGALAGMMLGDWVLPFAYNQTISGFDNAVFTWMLFGAAGALLALRRAREESDA